MKKRHRFDLRPMNPVHQQLSRRQAIKVSIGVAAAALWQNGTEVSAYSAPLLPPASLTKYLDPLPFPNIARPNSAKHTYYEIAMREIRQKLHRQLPATPLWAYDGSYPGPTIEARTNVPVTVKWVNRLPAEHLLPVDRALHGAEHDLPEVRAVVHLHGGHTRPEFDGYPEDWWTAGRNNSRIYVYDNNQPAATLWYHDHALAITRLNVYAGLAAFYILRDQQEEGLNLPRGKHEVPLAIQDRSFYRNGALFYPDSRSFFDGFAGPFAPESDVPPVWNPEFFGNTMLVNGKVWPYLEVEQRRYRLRLLNGCNSRFLIVAFDRDLPFHQIGGDGGFLPAPTTLDTLLMAPAERADVIVDFSTIPTGTTLHLLNVGPDEPFGGPGFVPADPDTTGQVMQFRVVKSRGIDKSTPPSELALPITLPLGVPSVVRRLSLNELDSTVIPDFGPVAALLGTDEGQTPTPLAWDDPITEDPQLGATEVWEIANYTMDAHPIHLHLVQFEVVNREDQDGNVRPPESWEWGRKDTVIAYPGEITRIKAHFDIPGLYVWHCHILEHEDNEMMRPYVVV